MNKARGDKGQAERAQARKRSNSVRYHTLSGYRRQVAAPAVGFRSVMRVPVAGSASISPLPLHYPPNINPVPSPWNHSPLYKSLIVSLNSLPSIRILFLPERLSVQHKGDDTRIRARRVNGKQSTRAHDMAIVITVKCTSGGVSTVIAVTTLKHSKCTGHISTVGTIAQIPSVGRRPAVYSHDAKEAANANGKLR
ncbi:hypothetical protein EVAR_28502_1 [Eumeta japonica]|uniref:Uncharacterized protein n=1 Tax=Eumeta variegata TaxID=151549 RepID=A0A4C1WQM9_EUMVA|nr:hypothetical protein EVAR_28502_1 [Eumeta japonica]